MLIRPTGPRGGLTDDRMQPGDLIASGRTINTTLTTVGAGTVTGAMIAAGIIARTGPTAGFVDTLDTAWNIITALAGNFPTIDAVQGISFELTYQNQVAFAMTLAAGLGVTLGSNVNVAASAVRDYLVTILNTTQPITVSSGTTNASKVVTFDQPIQTGTFDTTNNKGYGTLTPGMVVSGTGIAANTKVVGITYGDQARGFNPNFITGVTLDTNATATNASGINLLFSPNVRFDGLRSATA